MACQGSGIFSVSDFENRNKSSDVGAAAAGAWPLRCGAIRRTSVVGSISEPHIYPLVKRPAQSHVAPIPHAGTEPLRVLPRGQTQARKLQERGTFLLLFLPFGHTQIHKIRILSVRFEFCHVRPHRTPFRSPDKNMLSPTECLGGASPGQANDRLPCASAIVKQGFGGASRDLQTPPGRTGNVQGEGETAPTPRLLRPTVLGNFGGNLELANCTYTHRSCTCTRAR
jgi:hypothetical protein